MKINKKEIKNILIIISVIAILLIVAIGISYAYFTLNTVGTSKLDVTVETEKIPDLTFSSDNDLMLVADSSNFFIGNGDVSAETKPYALFEYNGEYTLEYSVYLNINSDFVYTTADKSPELILVIKDENGDYITSIDNLEFINYSENIKGFDVTESKGSFKIFENKEISTSSNQTSTKHEYTFELYFINLDTPQNENIDKTFNGEVIFRKSESKLNEHIMSLSNLNQGEGKLVHETYESDKSSLANNGIVDTGYRYQG